MATTAAPSTAEIWREALKCRRNLEKKAEQIQKNMGNGNESAYFEALDEALSTFRLGCMATVFTDFEFATEQKADKLLWNAHALINNKYRSVLAVLSSKVDPKVVLHRQVERKYGKFLRTSQYFYKGYLQRLSQRYPIAELQRVARSVQTDEVPMAEVAHERHSGLDAKVLSSCHATLLHLGDLARYRRQVDRKAHGFDKPLSYYRLAQDLVPTSGFGHHQMAVVFLAEKDQDLTVVYHLYRALAVQEPHPNALQNLEVEFKKLRPTSPPRGRNASLDPQVTLASWFVRLQAIFYTGESVPQQAELEGEVLHRLQMLLVTKDTVDLIMMLALTNITAYHVARQRAEEKWSAELSQSCQFMLSFNVRMILASSNVVKKEVQDALKAVPGDRSNSDSEPSKETERFLAAMAAAVPVLRVYMVWLCLHRADLVRYAGHLRNLQEMHTSLAETISLLIEVFRHENLDVKTAEYMLPEDIETLGLQPLVNEDAPFVCRALHFTLDGRQKRRLDLDSSGRLSDNLETLSRVNDIVNCGYFLATDPNYPLQIAQIPRGSRVLMTLTAAVENGGGGDQGAGISAGPFTQPATEPVTPRKVSAWSAAPAQPQTVAELGPAQAGAVAQEPGNDVELDASTDVEFGVDGETLDRVNEFLMPPEANSPKSPSLEEPSYGMHSATANEIFGALDPSAKTPTSASRKAFPALPWDLIYTPTPYRSGTAGVDGGSPGMGPATEFSNREYSHAAALELAGRLPTAPALESLGGQLQRGPRHRAASSQQLNTQLGRGEMFDRERMEEVAKAGSWKVEQRHHPAIVPASSMPPSRLPASSSLQSLSSLSSHSPVRAPQQQSPSYTATPFFQSSNFSPNASGLPQVNSPWGLPPAPRAPVLRESSMPAATPNWPAEASVWGRGRTGSSEQGNSQTLYSSFDPSGLEATPNDCDRNALLLQALAKQTKAQSTGRL